MEFRVQYIDDRDPCKLSVPAPVSPVRHKFQIDIPLIDQLPGIKDILDAPLDVSLDDRLVGV